MVRTGHPAASAHSAGKTYEEAIGSRWKMETPMPEFVKHMVVKNVADVEDVVKDVDFVFSAVNMPKDEIRAIEEEYAKTETPVVSNNSAHRWTPDVPMVVPEINPGTMRSSNIRRSAWAPRTVSLPSSRTAPSRPILRLWPRGRNSSRTRSS